MTTDRYGLRMVKSRSASRTLYQRLCDAEDCGRGVSLSPADVAEIMIMAGNDVRSLAQQDACDDCRACGRYAKCLHRSGDR